MPTKATESLEVIAALVVTAGLVSGNLFLFSPLRTDNRVKASPPPARSGEAAHPESSTKASIDGNFDPAASNKGVPKQLDQFSSADVPNKSGQAVVAPADRHVASASLAFCAGAYQSAAWFCGRTAAPIPDERSADFSGRRIPASHP